MAQIQIVGMAWFHADDYDSFRTVLPDRVWHPDFKAWEAAAEQNIQRLKAQGITAIKARVRSAEFVEWCRNTGRNINTEALTAFGAEAAYRHVQGDH